MLGRPKSERYKVGDVYQSNYGDFKIISVESAASIRIRFLLTGFEINKQAVHLDYRAVKDPYFPSFFGLAFIGRGAYDTKTSKVAYQKWKNMLTRCYSKEYQDKNPSYIGCIVSDEWHNFQNFAEWFENNSTSNENSNHLDKDIRGCGKIYSPSNCLLVTAMENNQEAHCKTKAFVSPDGEIHSILNLSKFARDNGLSQGHLSSVFTGARKTHKGWKKHIA